jgi:hypothetical protein
MKHVGTVRHDRLIAVVVIVIVVVIVFVAIVVVSLNGCALQPKDMASTPTKRLCDAYSAPLSPNLMDYAIKQELERRGQADCASPAAVATAVHAVMFVEPLTNATLPAVVAMAEMVTGLPYFAEVTDPGKESESVGVALVTVSVTVALVVTGFVAESLAVIVCV